MKNRKNRKITKREVTRSAISLIIIMNEQCAAPPFILFLKANKSFPKTEII